MKIHIRTLVCTVLFVIGMCLYLSSSFADAVYVANYGDGTPSLANVQAAFDAASYGDTIFFPENGMVTWSSHLVIDKPVTIDGSGTKLTPGSTMAYGFFYLKNFTSNELMRITGFTFDLINTSGGSAIYFYGLALTQLRIDHNTFHHGGTVMEVRGCKGVIDNNYLYNGHRTILFSAGTRTQADASWESMVAGTGDALFIEDNHFIRDSSWTGGSGSDQFIDTYNGGKLVIRYNNFDTTDLPSSFTSTCWTIQTHGSAAGGAQIGYWQADSQARRGQSIVEIYGNSMSGKRLGRLATLRGSANLVYNNSIDSFDLSTNIFMYEEESYVSSQWSPVRIGWPAEDQVHNTFIWNNTFNGNPQTESHIISFDEDWIQKDRDYFLHRPATNGEGMTLGKEVFTGANGASGTYPTDGVTYPTAGTMIFVPDVENAYYGYTAYIYPHPLTQTETAPQLSPPSGLRIK